MNQQQSQSSTPRRNNSEFSIDAQPVESESIMNLQIAYSWLTIALLIVILFNCFLTLLQKNQEVYQSVLSSFAFNLSFRIPILFLSIGHLLYLIKICITYHKMYNILSYSQSNKQPGMLFRVDVGYRINLLLCMFDQQDQSCLIYFVDTLNIINNSHQSTDIDCNNDLQMQYLAMFLVFMTIIWVIKSIFQQYRRNSQDHQQKLIIVLIRFCFVAQLMFINLKLIDWVSARWIYTFSIFWLFLLIVIMMQLVFLFKFSIIINRYFNSTVDQKPILIVQIVGYLWTNLIIFGFCGVPSYALYKLSFYLEENMDHDYLLAIIISVFYTLIFMVYTIYHKDMLSTFILRILQLHIQQQTVREPDIISFPSSGNQKKFVHTFRDNILNDFPKQLIKISSTYYLPEDKRNQTEINSAGLNNKTQHDGTLKHCFNCFQQQSCTVYIPCGHGGVCSKCAFDWFQERKECLICRSQIQAILKIVQTDDQRVKVVDIIALN